MEKRYAFLVLVLMVLFVGYYSYTITSPSTSPAQQTTGAASAFTFQSKAQILALIAISPSSNFTNGGIDFEVVDIGTTNNNATGNFDPSGLSEYYLEVIPPTNVKVDFCITSNQNLTLDDSLGQIYIPYPLYSFSNSTVNSPSIPSYPPTDVIPINDNSIYLKETTNVPQGGKNYYRFYLDVPANQPAGSYSNSVLLQVVRNGATNMSCHPV